MKIFLSAVSSQFKACRDALASDLRAVGAQVKVQEDFQQHGGTLLEKLEFYIHICDRVIFLVGNTYGWEPEVEALPPGRARRSYSQWEYFFACGERLDGKNQPAKNIFVYLASPDYLAENPVVQSEEAAKVQAQFIAQMRRSGKDYNCFGSLNELRALVLRDGFRIGEADSRLLCRPNLGEMTALLCDREPQTLDFTLNITRHLNDAVQIYVIYGEAEELHESLCQRFCHQVLQEEVHFLELDLKDQDGPDRFEQVSWPMEGDLDKREWSLVHEIYRKLGAGALMVHENLSAEPLRALEALKAHRFIVLEHYLHASKWDAATPDLLKWYRSSFWRPLSGRLGRPRFLILLNVIYPSRRASLIDKVSRLLSFPRRGEFESFESKLRTLFAPDPEAAAGYLLDRLRGVFRVDVERWFQETGLSRCFSFEECKKHLDQLFGASEGAERRMAHVQPYLQQLVKDFQAR